MNSTCFHIRMALAAVLGFCSIVQAQPVTTILTHGYSLEGSKGAWIEGMADAMIARAVAEGSATGGTVCRYDQLTGAWQLVSGSLDAEQPVCLIFRWLQDFAKPGAEWGYAEAAADALYAALRDASFIDGKGEPIEGFELVHDRFLHFLGHSRGVIVNSECVERFAVAGITVDHVTGFDPHPMNGTLDWPVNFDWGDPTPQRWDNIVFHDNYWRADGGFLNATDPDGIPIPGAHNVQLSESALNSGGYSTAHSDVHLWYHGTIDFAVGASDGEQTITQTMRNSWWPNGWETVGYYFSVIGGGSAMRPANGAGVPHGVVPTIVGGTFDQASHAGWTFHGGAQNASIVNEGGRTFLKLGSSFGTSSTHNRFLLPADAARVVFSYRILTPDGIGLDDALRMQLIDSGGSVTDLIGTIDLTQADAGWITDATFDIPLGVLRERVHRLRVFVDGGAQTHAVVGVDDLRIEFGIPASCLGDLVNSATVQPPPDGVVDGADLAFLLGEWGANPDSPADLVDSVSLQPPPDGLVDGADLAVMLGAWGRCD